MGLMRLCYRGFLLFLIVLPSLARSQDSSAVAFHGSFNASTEHYSSSGIEARRPQSIQRLIFAPTITLFDQISLPFEFYLSSEDRGFRQPFNQFGVSPKLFGWVTLHAGYYSATISDLTFGDARLLGGGIELTPGNFRFSFLYGRAQQAIDADTTAGVRGAYSRWLMAAKLGYGNPGGFFLDLNVLRAWDDSTSHANLRAGTTSDSMRSAFDLAPTENLVVSLSYGASFAGNFLRITGETAVSGFSNDTRSAEVEGGSPFVTSLFTPRFSSQVDGATSLSLIVTPSPAFSVSLNGKWVGPGYVTLGYPQFPNDMAEGTVAPIIRLLEGSLVMRGSVGYRVNNLRSTRLSTTERIIGSAMVNAQFSPEFGLDLQYANYGMRSNPRNDTLRIDNVSRTIGVSPRFTFASFGGLSTATLSYTFQDYTDFNTVTSNLSNNQTQSVVGIWSLTFPSALTLSTSLMVVSAKTSFLTTSIDNISESVSVPVFDRALSLGLTVGYNIVHAVATDGQFTARLSASLAMPGHGTLSASLANNSYSYGDPTSGSAYREYEGMLQYTMGF